MKTNIGSLIKVNLLQRFGINEVRYSRDPAKKRRLAVTAVVIAGVGLVLMAYIIGMAIMLCTVGAAESVPAVMMVLVSVVIFFFTLFKAGSVLFQMQTYEMLIALPITVRDIVVSRFFTMYLEDTVMTAFLMIPGCAVYAFYARTGILFWFMTVLGIFAIPLLPLVVSSILSVIITAAGARIKHKNVIMLVLSMLLVVGILIAAYLPVLLNPGQEMSLVDLGNIGSMIADQINSSYFMAALYTDAVVGGNAPVYVLFLTISVLPFLLFVFLVERYFVRICTALVAKTAKGNYSMKKLRQQTVLKALYQKELKRYFASNVYVMNTAIGYVMTILLALVVAVMGPDKLQEVIPIPGLTGKILPFLLAWTVVMAAVSASSISIEGKNWWIPMSLPLDAKELVQGKVMMHLSLALPTCVLAAAVLSIRLYREPVTLLMAFLIPAAYSVLTAVMGIVINQHLPMMKWDNEVVVVKQSAATMTSIFSSFLLAGAPMAAVIAAPESMEVWMELLIVLLLLAVSVFLYIRAIKFDFRKIEA